MGKGSKRRPRLVSKAEEDLRWLYAKSEGRMSLDEFNRRLAKIRKENK